jgi:mannosyltransferase OCH1-like enzyme
MSFPKLVWLLWLQGWDTAPWLVQQVRASWALHNPDWEVRCVSGADWTSHLPAPPPFAWNDTRVTLQARSDIVRVALLASHGGVWADASVLCMAPLSQWIADAAAPGSFFTYGENMGAGLSAWFIAAQAESYVLREWYNATNTFWSR